MPVLWVNTAGNVGAFPLGGGFPIQVDVGANALSMGNAALRKSVITGYSLAGESGVQFSHSLRERVYVHVFGERVHELTFNGVCFPALCGVGTGFEAMLAYYETIRTSRIGIPIQVYLGPSAVFAGFLVGFGFQLADASSGLGVYAMRFKLPPRL